MLRTLSQRLSRRSTLHDRITALFLFFGAVIPLILTFALVYYAPHLYDDGVQTAAPWIQAMREQVTQLHDARALNAFAAAR